MRVIEAPAFLEPIKPSRLSVKVIRTQAETAHRDSITAKKARNAWMLPSDPLKPITSSRKRLGFFMTPRSREFEFRRPNCVLEMQRRGR